MNGGSKRIDVSTQFCVVFSLVSKNELTKACHWVVRDKTVEMKRGRGG